MKDFLKFVLAIVGVAFVGAIVLLTVSAVKQKPIKELLSKKKAVESVVDATTDDKGDEEQPVVEEKNKFVYSIEDAHPSTLPFKVGESSEFIQFNTYDLDSTLYEYVVDAAVVPVKTINANNEESEVLLYRSQSIEVLGSGPNVIYLIDNPNVSEATIIMCFNSFYVYHEPEVFLYTTTELTFDFSTLVDEEEHYSVIDFAEDDFWCNYDEGCYSCDLSNELLSTFSKNQMIGLQVNLKDGTTKYAVMTRSDYGNQFYFSYNDDNTFYYIQNNSCRFNINIDAFYNLIDSISLYVQNK